MGHFLAPNVALDTSQDGTTSNNGIKNEFEYHAQNALNHHEPQYLSYTTPDSGHPDHHEHDESHSLSYTTPDSGHPDHQKIEIEEHPMLPKVLCNSASSPIKKGTIWCGEASGLGTGLAAGLMINGYVNNMINQRLHIPVSSIPSSSTLGQPEAPISTHTN